MFNVDDDVVDDDDDVKKLWPETTAGDVAKFVADVNKEDVDGGSVGAFKTICCCGGMLIFFR